MAYTISDEERARRAERMKQVRAQKKTGDADEAPCDLHRFALPDLEDMGAWLVERLKGRWGAVSDKNIAAFLRGVMESNEFLFVRTRNAVALAQAAHKPLEAVPFVEEIFVLVRNDAVEEGVQLYGAIRNWGESHGASRIEVGNMTDVEPEDVASAFGGRIETRVQCFAALRAYHA